MKKQTKPRYIAELSVHAFRCLMLNSCKSMVVNSNYVCKSIDVEIHVMKSLMN